MNVSVRPARSDADRTRSLEIYNAVSPDEAVTEEEAAAWEAGLRAHEEFVASVDGVDAGSAVAAESMLAAGNCFALLTVLPEHRRRGAGDALYRAVSSWARERGLSGIETRVAGDDDASLAFAVRRGFHEHSRETGMELDLTRAAVTAFPPPPGVELTTLGERPDLGPQVYDVECEAAPDVPGYEDEEMPPREHWLEHHLLRPAMPPAAYVLAVAGDEVIGYARLRVDPSGRAAMHAMTGVKRAWRGRGVARALKSKQIAWAKAQGLERLSTTNELRNAPMRRVNELFGYREVAGRVHLRGPLAPE